MRLYIKRKGGGKGLISMNDSVKEEELSLLGYMYVKASDEWMLKVVGETLQVGETKNK